MVTPERLFDGSPDAVRFVSYRIAGTLELAPREWYQHKYWMPGLLAQVRAGKQPKPKQDIARSIPPRVRFTDGLKTGTELRPAEPTVRVVGEGRSGFPTKAFRLLVDGRHHGGPNGTVQVPDPKPGEQKAEWAVELDPGRHTIKVLADTEYVQGASELEGLRGRGNGEAGDRALAPTRIDGGVYLSGLYAYVSARVRQLTKGYQTPVHGTPRSSATSP